MNSSLDDELAHQQFIDQQNGQEETEREVQLPPSRMQSLREAPPCELRWEPAAGPAHKCTPTRTLAHM